MNIAQQLQAIMMKEPTEFIHSLYLEILDREPDSEGFDVHKKSLIHGFSKLDVFHAIMCSGEAQALLSYPVQQPTRVIHQFQFLMQKEDASFITELYSQLLCRQPDIGGFQLHSSRLRHGVPKISILMDFMFSEESRERLRAVSFSQYPIPAGGLHVHNIGTMFETTGYAAANRHLMLELVKSGVNTRFTPHHMEQHCVELNPISHVVINRLIQTKLPEQHIVLFCFPAQYFFRDQHYTIGFTMYELSRIPKSWVSKCRQMDEIWVPSTFNYATFTASGMDASKIRVMPLGVNPEIFHTGLQPLSILQKRKFSFLWTVSGSILDLRKGVDVLIPAFLEEFSEVEDVCLILKSRASSEEQIQKQQAFVNQLSIKTSGRIRHSVILICTTESWSEDMMAQLYNSVNCYVFPTRGEGWSLTVMEAMACGLPVITTNWSAHLDYVQPTNGYLIRQKLVHYSEDQLWANPDKQHLRSLMRHVFEHQDEAKEKAQEGARLIRSEYTWETCARRIYNRLYEIQQTIG